MKKKNVVAWVVMVVVSAFLLVGCIGYPGGYYGGGGSLSVRTKGLSLGIGIPSAGVAVPMPMPMPVPYYGGVYPYGYQNPYSYYGNSWRIPHYGGHHHHHHHGYYGGDYVPRYYFRGY